MLLFNINILPIECPHYQFIVHFVTMVLAWPELVGDEMNYELVIWTPGNNFILVILLPSEALH